MIAVAYATSEGASNIRSGSSEQPPARKLPQGFAGGTPQLWDRIHQQNQPRTSVYSLRSAPERAILGVVMAACAGHSGGRVSELGCGSSRYLPHLARRTEMMVGGADFSSKGIRDTRQAVHSVGADASLIVEARLEEYVPAHKDSFDVVFSAGLIEHFQNLRSVIAWHFECVRPGGHVVIAAPNLDRMNLSWARRIAPDLFDWHRPISAEEVASHFPEVGAKGIDARYLGGPRLFAYPTAKDDARTRVAFARGARKVVNGCGELLSRAAGPVANRLAGATLSPFFAVSAMKAELEPPSVSRLGEEGR